MVQGRKEVDDVVGMGMLKVFELARSAKINVMTEHYSFHDEFVLIICLAGNRVKICGATATGVCPCLCELVSWWGLKPIFADQSFIMGTRHTISRQRLHMNTMGLVKHKTNSLNADKRSQNNPRKMD